MSAHNPEVPGESAAPKRGLRVWLLGGVLFCLMFFLLHAWSPWEARHDGIRLSDWIELLDDSDKQVRDSAKTALFEIGAPAVPALAEMIADRETAFDRRYAKLHTKLPKLVAGLVPEPWKPNPEARNAAGEILRDMGPAVEQGLGKFRAIIVDPEHPGREHAIHAIGGVLPADAKTVSALARTWVDVQDSGPGIILGFILEDHPEAAEFAAPILLERLEAERSAADFNDRFQIRAMELLAYLQPDSSLARQAVEVLSGFANSGDHLSRAAAQIVIWKLAPDRPPPATRATKLIEYLQADEHQVQMEAFLHDDPGVAENAEAARRLVNALVGIGRGKPDLRMFVLVRLHGLGPAAKPALPFLREMAADPNQQTQLFAINALWAVSQDPEEVMPILSDIFADRGEPDANSSYEYFAQSLSQIGPPAKAIAPRLREIMDQQTHWISSDLALPHAWFRVTGDVQPLLELVGKGLQKRADEPIKQRYSSLAQLRFAAEMGEKAESLVPNLVRILNHPYTPKMERKAALKAVLSIAPEQLALVERHVREEHLPQIQPRN